MEVKIHLPSLLRLSSVLLLLLLLCLVQAADVSDSPVVEATQGPLLRNNEKNQSAPGRPSVISWGLRVEPRRGNGVHSGGDSGHAAEITDAGNGVHSGGDSGHAAEITDADMIPVLNGLLRRIVAGANSTFLSSGDGGGGSSSMMGVRVPLRVPLKKPNVNFSILRPFKIPIQDDPVEGMKQFGVLSENGQKYRECVRKQKELGVWNRRICIPNLKRGKGNINVKRNKNRDNSNSTISDDSTDSLEEIPWSQKVLKLIMEGKDIDDYLEKESSQSENYDDAFEEESITSLDKDASTINKSNVEILKDVSEELPVSEKVISNDRKIYNSDQMRKKKKKKKKRGSDTEAQCGYTYGLGPGDSMKFVFPKNKVFCEALFVASEGTSLSFRCKKFKLTLGCSQEYLYLANGVIEVIYCNQDGPEETSNLQSIYMMYERNKFEPGRSKLLCTAKGHATSTGGTGSGANGTDSGGIGGGGTGGGGITGGNGFVVTTGSQNQICPSTCGIAPHHTGANRIVGGSEASIGEYPWMALVMVMIGDNEIAACGGTIVTKDHVITAAHCFGHRSLDGATVIVGEHDVTLQNEANSQRIYASVFIKHPSYDDDTQANDIMILELSEPIKWRSHVGPLCLATNADYDGYLAIVTGWGVTTPRASSTLQEVAVRVLKPSECRKKYEGQYVITEKQVCAAAPGKDSCQGDSGGPLVFVVNNRWYHLGIVSFGIGCAQDNFPGVYTFVPYYRDWILQHVANGRC